MGQGGRFGGWGGAVVALGALLAGWLAVASDAHAQWRSRPLVSRSSSAVRDLGTLGGALARANAVNEAGWIVGAAEIDSGGRAAHHAFVKPPMGRMMDIDGGGGRHSEAVAIGEDGTVVGVVYASNKAHSNAFRWSARGGYEDLPNPDDARRAAAVGVDARGNVVVNGQNRSGGGPDAVFVLRASDRGYEALPTLQGGDVEATGVNARGDIVGIARDAESHVRPVLWDGATHRVQQLLLPAESEGTDEAWPMAINARGTVVGTLYREGLRRAVAWVGADHTLEELGEGDASAVNDRDVVVGSGPRSGEQGGEVARAWDLARGRSVDLPGLRGGSAFDASARDVNNAGLAVGDLSDEGSAMRAVSFGYVSFEP